jgi:UDP-N-acetylmuramate-alanine ligase
VAHHKEIDYLRLSGAGIHMVDDNLINSIKLAGQHNRENAAAVATAINMATELPLQQIVDALNSYPGSNRRFERIAKNIYTDYAHTPEEIAATLQLAKELKDEVVVVYEPLTNRRQHFMINTYRDVFKNLSGLYWVPSYLAREDPNLEIIVPQQFVDTLEASANAKAAELNEDLKNIIINSAKENKLVILFAGGGGGSLDEWARKNLVA